MIRTGAEGPLITTKLFTTFSLGSIGVCVNLPTFSFFSYLANLEFRVTWVLFDVFSEFSNFLIILWSHSHFLSWTFWDMLRYYTRGLTLSFFYFYAWNWFFHKLKNVKNLNVNSFCLIGVSQNSYHFRSVQCFNLFLPEVKYL